MVALVGTTSIVREGDDGPRGSSSFESGFLDSLSLFFAASMFSRA
jgi:hypothetical protein